jgi:hypothetical protein
VSARVRNPERFQSLPINHSVLVHCKAPMREPLQRPGCGRRGRIGEVDGNVQDARGAS